MPRKNPFTNTYPKVLSLIKLSTHPKTHSTTSWKISVCSSGISYNSFSDWAKLMLKQCISSSSIIEFFDRRLRRFKFQNGFACLSEVYGFYNFIFYNPAIIVVFLLASITSRNARAARFRLLVPFICSLALEYFIVWITLPHDSIGYLPFDVTLVLFFLQVLIVIFLL